MVSRRLRAFGLVAAIEADDPELFDRIDRQLPPFPLEPDGTRADLTYRVTRAGGTGVTIVRGRRTIGVAHDAAEAGDLLVRDFQTTLARTAAGWTFIHAGVVAIDGRALLLPARSASGKSTLVMALVRAGATYGSDEFAVLDREGDVYPYARPLALRVGSGAVARISAADLGGAVLRGRTPVGAVLFTRFEPGASLSLEPISPGAMVLRLVEHALGARGRAADTLAALRALACRAPGFESARGHADSIAEALVDRIRHLALPEPADHQPRT